MFFFLPEKEKGVKKKTRHEKHAQMGFEHELLTSRVTIQHVSTCAFSALLSCKYLKVLNLSFDKKIYILPFLTAAQRKHVQIHVMKTCRQASVTNSLLTLNFF